MYQICCVRSSEVCFLVENLRKYLRVSNLGKIDWVENGDQEERGRRCWGGDGVWGSIVGGGGRFDGHRYVNLQVLVGFWNLIGLFWGK